MAKKMILISAVILTALLLTVSFLLMWSAKANTPAAARANKAVLLYQHSTQLLLSGDEDRAITGFTTVITRYGDSIYAEKSLRDLALLYRRKGDDDKAVQYYKKLLKDFPDVKDSSTVREEVEKVNMVRQFSPAAADGSVEYAVVPGDSLYAIAKKFNTTVALIKKMNGLGGDVIHPGQKLKINAAKFSIHIVKSANTLILDKNGVAFKTYSIATGRNNKTPVGVFAITDKMVKPPWTAPDGRIITPDSGEYELGERWMGISAPGYGIHGTKDETSIGKDVTAGCVRMHNKDVVELYDIVTVGTEVRIDE